MKKNKQENDSLKIKKISWAGTISLLTLLLLFMVVMLISTGNLTSQIILLTEHPFTVNGDVSDVKTNLALMRIRTERLQSYNQPEDIESVRAALNELYLDMDALMEEINELYLGPDEDIESLLDTYQELKHEQQRFLEFAKLPESTTTVIAKYEEEHLYSLYDEFDENVTTILTYVRSTQQNIFSSAMSMSQSTVVWAIVIILATATTMLYFQSVIRRISQRLFFKNRQFEILSNTIDETFMIFDGKTDQCEFVSGSAERVTGIPAELLMKNRMLLYEHMEMKIAEKIFKEIHEEGNNVLDKMVEYHDPKEPESRWLQLKIYKVGDNGDSKYIMTIIDRTEERRVNQTLQDALTSAQKANNAKKDFLSRMSHEIRTPMNAIIGMATIAAASMDDSEKVENCLEKIAYSSKHLLMLINDVLDMSRIESNRISIHAEPFELYQFINSFIGVIYPQAKEKELEFIEKISGFTENTTYMGDTLRLNQILLNLISNAIKFTPNGGKVTLEVTNLQSHGKCSWIRFVVSDTGIGMDEEGLSKLYIPFEQANSRIAGKYGGTGLGMSITQNLVSLMGGHIGVVSKLGEGTTFTVELPFEQSGVTLMPVQEESMESLKVLVVDDEKDICEHAVLLLEKMKIQAEWVLSGEEALARAIAEDQKGCGFDVCFIDWKMPGMDGVETARRIRKEIGPDTPIIIISAYDWSDIEQEARAVGVNAFIAKPMFASSIYNALVRVTNGAFYRAEAAPINGGNLLKGKRLLVAEDNILNTEIVITLLEMNGAKVESAENGYEAVQNFMNKEPGYFDAILMDVQMPIMDGCEATRQIRACGREDGKTIPIIATTANAFAEDVSMVMEAGMDAHVGKPLDMHQLYELLTSLCKSKNE